VFYANQHKNLPHIQGYRTQSPLPCQCRCKRIFGPARNIISPGEDTIYDSETVFAIKSLRPSKSGNNQTGPAFDEAAANECMPTMPDALKMRDGTKVTTPGQWAKRRAEILEDFDFLEYRERSYRLNPFCVSSG